MAQVLTIGVFAFLFLQLAAGQDACQDALNTLTNNVATCTATPQNPTVICEGVCRGYFDDIFDSCPDALAAASRQTFDATCASFTQGPATTQATQGPTTTDDTPNDACLAALNTLTNNVATCTATPQNPTVICEGVCRGYFDDIFDSCPDALAAASRQTFDAACASFTQGPATTQATQGPTTTDDTPNDACLAALGRLPASCTPTSENDVDTICSGECRGFYDDVAANCPSDEDAAQILNSVCEATTQATQGPATTQATQGPATTQATQGPATTQATQGPATTDTASEACTAALERLVNAPASCTPTSQNICSGECRGIYEDVAANCPDNENAAQTLNSVCGGAGVIKGLGIYSLMLLSVIAAVVF